MRSNYDKPTSVKGTDNTNNAFNEKMIDFENSYSQLSKASASSTTSEKNPSKKLKDTAKKPWK